uniref:Picrinine-N-methytransferase n=1 Tax=Vinca minor TaxID=60093 RepID=PINMT_VINMI|nr:RecName: Full=Picrinine-N-methytransferase; Short=VmPiNMT; AltName: Full=Gamma-tocopherol-like methyltransferase PiNMT; Short=VmTLMT [Vinca minor]AHH02782.1 tocopherol-like methyltransferase [Vinca minor]
MYTCSIIIYILTFWQLSKIKKQVAAAEKQVMTVTEKQEAVAEFYDKSTDAWEVFFGEHLHDGFYEPGTTATIPGSKVAVVRMIDELLRFAGISDDPEKKPKTMLDVGCGLGGTCLHVAKKYDIKCTGITISPEQVKCAQDLAATQGLESKVSFDVGDALDMPYKDGTFDLVFTIQCIEHIQDKEKFIREMVRVAAPGAPVVIAGYAARNLSPSEESLKPEEKMVLEKICDHIVLSWLCSTGDYVKWLTPLPVQDIKVWDLTQNITPFYPLCIKEAFTWKSFTSLLKMGGWSAIKVVFAVKMMAMAAEEGLLKFAAVTCRKSK